MYAMDWDWNLHFRLLYEVKQMRTQSIKLKQTYKSHANTLELQQQTQLAL